MSAYWISTSGDSAPFAILLGGPSPAIARQGPALIRALRSDPEVTTLSPWDGRTLARLRPSPRRAFVLVDFHVPTAEVVGDVVPHLDATLARVIRPPVRANQTGLASLTRAIQEESIASTERAELIALPSCRSSCWRSSARRKLILAQVYSQAPPGAFVLAFKLKKRRGIFGTVMSTSLPPSAQGWAYLTRFEMTLHRRYRYHGRAHSYVSAACGAPAGFPGAVFPFASARYGFANGQTLERTVIRSCKVRA